MGRTATRASKLSKPQNEDVFPFLDLAPNLVHVISERLESAGEAEGRPGDGWADLSAVSPSAVDLLCTATEHWSFGSKAVMDRFWWAFGYNGHRRMEKRGLLMGSGSSGAPSLDEKDGDVAMPIPLMPNLLTFYQTRMGRRHVGHLRSFLRACPPPLTLRIRLMGGWADSSCMYPWGLFNSWDNLDGLLQVAAPIITHLDLRRLDPTPPLRSLIPYLPSSGPGPGPGPTKRLLLSLTFLGFDVLRVSPTLSHLFYADVCRLPALKTIKFEPTAALELEPTGPEPHHDPIGTPEVLNLSRRCAALSDFPLAAVAILECLQGLLAHPGIACSTLVPATMGAAILLNRDQPSHVRREAAKFFADVGSAVAGGESGEENPDDALGFMTLKYHMGVHRSGALPHLASCLGPSVDPSLQVQALRALEQNATNDAAIEELNETRDAVDAGGVDAMLAAIFRRGAGSPAAAQNPTVAGALRVLAARQSHIPLQQKDEVIRVALDMILSQIGPEDPVALDVPPEAVAATCFEAGRRVMTTRPLALYDLAIGLHTFVAQRPPVEPVNAADANWQGQLRTVRAASVASMSVISMLMLPGIRDLARASPSPAPGCGNVYTSLLRHLRDPSPMRTRLAASSLLCQLASCDGMPWESIHSATSSDLIEACFILVKEAPAEYKGPLITLLERLYIKGLTSRRLSAWGHYSCVTTLSHVDTAVVRSTILYLMSPATRTPDSWSYGLRILRSLILSNSKDIQALVRGGTLPVDSTPGWNGLQDDIGLLWEGYRNDASPVIISEACLLLLGTLLLTYNGKQRALHAQLTDGGEIVPGTLPEADHVPHDFPRPGPNTLIIRVLAVLEPFPNLFVSIVESLSGLKSAAREALCDRGIVAIMHRILAATLVGLNASPDILYDTEAMAITLFSTLDTAARCQLESPLDSGAKVLSECPEFSKTIHIVCDTLQWTQSLDVMERFQLSRQLMSFIATLISAPPSHDKILGVLRDWSEPDLRGTGEAPPKCMRQTLLFGIVSISVGLLRFNAPPEWDDVDGDDDIVGEEIETTKIKTAIFLLSILDHPDTSLHLMIGNALDEAAADGDESDGWETVSDDSEGEGPAATAAPPGRVTRAMALKAEPEGKAGRGAAEAPSPRRSSRRGLGAPEGAAEAEPDLDQAVPAADAGAGPSARALRSTTRGAKRRSTDAEGSVAASGLPKPRPGAKKAKKARARVLSAAARLRIAKARAEVAPLAARDRPDLGPIPPNGIHGHGPAAVGANGGNSEDSSASGGLMGPDHDQEDSQEAQEDNEESGAES